MMNIDSRMKDFLLILGFSVEEIKVFPKMKEVRGAIFEVGLDKTS